MKIKFIFYLGLDISKATFHYRLDDARGEALASGQLPNQKEGFAALLEALQAAGVSDFRAVHAAMEATGRYGLALWHALVAAALPVSVLNPARVKAFGRTLGRRSKNDSGDAALLAAFARIHQPHLVWPDSPAIASLKELTGEIEHLTGEMVRIKNRAREVGQGCPVVAASLARQLAAIQAEMAAIKQAATDLCKSDPDLKRRVDLLCSVPGIGALSAWRVLAQIGSKSFGSARQLSAYAGTCPAHNTSGTSLRGKTRLSKVGNARLRKALYMPATVLKRQCNEVAAWADAIASRLGSKKAALGAVMRKLVHVIYGILEHGKPFDPARVAAPVN
jgi:transposase